MGLLIHYKARKRPERLFFDDENTERTLKYDRKIKKRVSVRHVRRPRLRRYVSTSIEKFSHTILRRGYRQFRLNWMMSFILDPNGMMSFSGLKAVSSRTNVEWGAEEEEEEVQEMQWATTVIME